MLDHRADEDIRNNIFTTNDTCMTARVTDNVADRGVTQLLLLTVIYFRSAVDVIFPNSNIVL